jgi:hypothetical protein
MPVHRANPLAPPDAAAYRRHDLHSAERLWTEKNCYIDIWIELVHSLGLDPVAMLAFTVAVDFEGDQWTFFKPPHEDLRTLYGIDVQELYVWRPLLDHAIEHLGAGRFISTEADAFWLPDTAGTDYRQQHTKTTIVLAEVDPQARSLGYFHNAGYHTLGGEDFAQLFRLEAAPDPAYMPLFAELVRHDRVRREPAAALRSTSLELLRKHLRWRSTDNPVRRFQVRFERDLPVMMERGLPYYHAWVFGSLRQLGASAELLALYVEWLGTAAGSDAAAAVPAGMEISSLCKSLILKTARAVNSKRSLDAAAALEPIAVAWDRVTRALSSLR